MRSLSLLSSMISSIGALSLFNNTSTPIPRTSGQHRTTSNTRLGRSLISPSSQYRGNSHPEYLHTMITSSDKEIAAWNDRVDQRNQDKILLKAARLQQQRNAWNNRKLAVPDLGSDANEIAYGVRSVA